MALGDSAGLLFRIKADGDQAVREFNRVDRAAKDLDSGAGGAFGGLGSKANIAALATTALTVGITATVTAAVQASKALFDLAVSTSEYGSKVFDTTQKTGLGAEAITALQFAAEQSGSSFEQVTKGITNFGVELGKASQGSEEAQKKMAALGVTSDDLETALGQVFKTISEGKTDTDKLALATEAFGKRIGPDLIPLIKDANGNFGELIQKAKELGVTLNDEQARTADEFGDALDLLSSQASNTARVFALEFMPQITDAMRDISQAVLDNRQTFEEWGNSVGNVIRGVTVVAKSSATSVIASLASWALELTNIVALYRVLESLGAIDRKGELSGKVEGFVLPSGPSTFTGGGRGRGGGGAGRSRINEAERLEARDLAAQIRIESDRLKDAADNYSKVVERLREVYKATGDAEAFRKSASEALTAYTDEVGQVLSLLTELENRQAAARKATTAELDLLLREQQQRVTDLQSRSNEIVDRNNKLVTDDAKRTAEATEEIWERLRRDAVTAANKLEDDLKSSNERYVRETVEANSDIIRDVFSSPEVRRAAQQAIIDDLVSLAAFLTELADLRRQRDLEANEEERTRRKKEIEDTIKDERDKLVALEALDKLFKDRALGIEADFQAEKARIAAETEIPIIAVDDGGEGGIFAKWTASWIEFFERVTGDAPSLQQSLGDLAGILQNAFEGVASAVGSVVQQWVLYGKTGPDVMRKILASALASIAAEAAVRAIYELAAGFAMLFLNPAEAAAHFQAAALFGSIAVGAALAGRAVAGNSFNRETSTATGGASGGRTTERDTSGQGQQFSSQSDVTRETGVTRPHGVPVNVRLSIADDSRFLSKFLKMEIEENGQTRQLIRRAAEGG